MAPQPPLVQTKLTVGPPDDEYEQEADRVAEQVMSMPEPKVRPSELEKGHEEKHLHIDGDMTIRRQTDSPDEELASSEPAPEIPISEEPATEEEFVPSDDEVLQTKRLPGAQSKPPASTGQELTLGTGAGQVLPDQSRRFMEQRFGVDFGHVLVHADDQAARLDEAMAARAFTFGRDIYFASGEYRPGTTTGDLLLAHELAHVVQQSNEMVSRKEAGTAMPQLRVPVPGVVQRSEALYFSTHGDQSYFREAGRFHKDHGFPAPVKVSSIEEMLENMRGLSRPINRVRVVTHAAPAGILLPLLRGGASSLFEQDMQLQSTKALEQELGVEHPTRANNGNFQVETEEFHIAPREWVGEAWKQINWTRGGPEVLIDHIALLGDAPTGERGDQADLEMHSFFWWILDRELLTNKLVWKTIKAKKRETLLDLFKRNVAIFSNQLVRGRWGTAGSLGRLEAMIVQVAPPLIKQRMAPGAPGVDYKLPEERYHSVQSAVERGTYIENLQLAWLYLANGAALEIRGCRIGQNIGWLEAFRDLFSPGSRRPHVSAPRLRDVFGIRKIRRDRKVQIESLEWLQDGRKHIYPGDPEWEQNFAHVS